MRPDQSTPKIPTRELLQEFDRWHRLVLGLPAVIQRGKDATLITGLCRSHGPEFVRALIAEFFESDDDFIRRAGYSVGVFVSQAPKLIARRHAPVRSRVPSMSSTLAWRDDCDRRHGGRCGSATFHAAKVESEA